MPLDKWTCEACQRQVDADENVCPHCGYQAEEGDEQLTVKPEKSLKTHYHQVVYVARDCSGSMSGQKAQEATQAVNDLEAELARPESRDGYWSMVVDFDTCSTVVQPLAKATLVHATIPPINVRGCTSITSALEKIRDFMMDPNNFNIKGVKWKDPVLVLFSDGCHNTGPGPEPAADQIKMQANGIIVCAGFGSDADMNMLRRIATTPGHAYMCQGGAELKRWMAEVGKTVTSTSQAALSGQLGKLKI